MLRINVNVTPAGAKSYYSTADYYAEGQELAGRWRGLGAERLGLSGNVEQKDWDALCDNRHPETGTKLTPRQNATRRVGYDFNFHAPKSVSLLYALSKDDRILEAFRSAVDETMRDLETETETRVRKGYKNEDRVTGNMVWGEFVHLTARPIAGEPDPHLHAHCFVFNVTHDAVEERWKAGEFSRIKQSAPYYEALFHARLANHLRELGLPIERKINGWEIGSLSRATLEKFSRRTELIEEAAARRGITDPREKSELGAKTRERKRGELSFDELRSRWRARLTPEEEGGFSGLAGKVGGIPTAIDTSAAARACDLALEHCLERQAVVAEREVLIEAFKRGYGQVPPEAIQQALDGMNLLRGEQDGRKVVTTPEVLKEERRMIAFARDGRGTCPGLAPVGQSIQRDWLNDDQRRAVRHVWESPDRVIMVRGAAGTGKTTMMREAVEGIEANGKKVFAFAPSAEASRGVLRNDGFENAETVARLLIDPQLQAQVRNQALWIDEAGLLGSRTMGQVFELAGDLNCRVILSGDRRQHSSVERGSVLRLLEQEAGVLPAELREIQRQSGRYKQAVYALSRGDVERGFRELDGLGWIREVPGEDRYRQLAGDYVDTVLSGKSALVISPTHREGERITAEIRAELKGRGKLGSTEIPLPVLENTHWTLAQRKDAVNYRPGDVLIFNKPAKGFRKGQRVVVGRDSLPLEQADRFQVFRVRDLTLAPGDLIRVTQNCKTADGRHRLNNGARFTVKEIAPDRAITLTNGWTLAPGFGHLTHGYVTTSHASQGTTVERVFIGQSSDSMKAASREQLYVSVSRGRKQAVIYTDDNRALLVSVRQSAERASASELMERIDDRARRAMLDQITQSAVARIDRGTERERKYERV